MPGSTESLGLTLTADTSGWESAFAQATQSARKLGNEVSVFADAFDSFLEKGPGNIGSMLDEASRKAKGFGSVLKNSWGDEVANIGGLLSQVEKKGFSVAGAIGSITKGLGALGLAVAGVDAIVGFAKASLEAAQFSAELANLRANVPTDALQAMNASMDGSVDEVELLRFGMKALNSEVHFSVEGLGVLTKAADTLSDKGFGPAMDIAEEFQRALETGNTSRLARFGVKIKETGDKQRDLNAAMVEFARVASLPVNVNPSLVAIEALQKRTRDWMNDMKAGLGDIVTWTVGAFDTISDQLTGTGGGARGIAERNVMAKYGGGMSGMAAFADPAVQAEIAAEEARINARTRSGEISALPMQGHNTLLAMAKAASGELAGDGMGWGRMFAGRKQPGGLDVGGMWRDVQMWNATHKGKKGAGGKRQLADSFLGMQGSDFQDRFGAMALGADRGLTAGLGAFGDWVGPTGSEGTETGLDFFSGAGEGGMEAAMQGQAKRMQEFQAQLEDSSTAIGGAFSVASSGILAAVDAAITGSESMGRAFQRASAMALQALAKEHAVRALAAGAMALGALAMGNVAGAGKFGQEAAMHAAVAAAAGLGAASLGGGGGGNSGGPSTPAGGGGYVGGQSQASGPQTSIYNIYGAVTSGDYQRLGGTLEKAKDAGRASGRTRDESTVTVHFD